jgi:hypothetical protein
VTTPETPQESTKPRFVVLVDDNFHYMDESERWQCGTFDTLEDAVAACKVIVEASLREAYQPGMSARALYATYQMFGDDPFIRAEGVTRAVNADGEPAVLFSAWTYARERAEEICGGGKPLA